MTQKDNILKELSELNSTLATITPQNVYTIPVGYFDGLAAQVLNRIKAMEAATAGEELNYLSPLLGSFSREMPYTVPSGYFESLEEKLVQTALESNDYHTAKEELETLSPFLSGLKKQMPYSVPQGYFESLSAGRPDLAEKITAPQTQTTAKVISITRRKWFRYAAAAVITGMIAMAGFLYFGGEKEPGGKILAKFTRDVKKMDDTQKDNLADFIDAGMNGQESAQVGPDKSNEVKDLLKGVSEEELKDFEEQTEDIQDILMTN
ncbi:MAG: hypothetical protein H7Y01_15870 [Ferruginibacter sp.]|nr:hypothetical protein [Chitinophagaceae bacterium]